jgi:hypothetical protein
MKSWIILIVLAVVLTAAATVAVQYVSSEPSTDLAYPAPAKSDGPDPAIEVVENLTYDFGVLPQQYTGHHIWTLKNTGPGPLELRGVTSTCSCTSAALLTEDKQGKEVIVKPGASYPLEVTFQTKEWHNFNQHVTVATNDPNHPTVNLSIIGVAKPPVTSVPPDKTVAFGPVGNEEPTMRKVAVFSNDRPDLKLTKLTSTNPALIEATPRAFTPEEAKGYQVEKGYIIDITLKPSSHLGAFAEELLIETDHPQGSEVRFKLTGKVTGPIMIVPERVTVRGATTKNGGTEPFKIVARGQSSVKFDVEKKPKDFDVSIEPMAQPAGAKGSSYRMIVKVIPGAESGRIVDEIVLKTDAPLASEVRVPVDVLVQGAK